MALPLSDPVPLRTTATWPKFAKPEPLPVVYGRCTVPAVRYDESRKFWLLADHAIAGVDAVYRDAKPAKAYAFQNTTDPAGRPVAVLELATALGQGESLAVALRGKVHSDTGALVENPADVLADVLRLAGYTVAEPDLTGLRSEFAGLAIAGILSADLTLRAQLSEIAESIGLIWSPGMPGLGRRWPLSRRPAGEPVHARLTERDASDVQASCQHQTLYTALRIEFDWDWAKNSARRSVTLQADSAGRYGHRETTLAAKWLTDPAAAAARGTAWLQEFARPRWRIGFSADLDVKIPVGGWFALEHPLLPVSGDLLALDSEWDWGEQRQRVSAEVSAGPVPVVAVANLGGLFAEPESGLRVTYADGIATLVIADPNGAPIRDATVTLGSQKGKTDRNGAVRFKIARGTYAVTVEADGFAPMTMEITL